MNNDFIKYRYLGMVGPEVPNVWKPTILKMIIKIDEIVKPKYIPRSVLNLLNDLSYRKGKEFWFFHNWLNKLVKDINITQIKQKFAGLRVYGTFNDEIQKVINEAEVICNNTCEYCGTTGTTNTMVKGWLRNLCPKCKEKPKK